MVSQQYENLASKSSLLSPQRHKFYVMFKGGIMFEPHHKNGQHLKNYLNN